MKKTTIMLIILLSFLFSAEQVFSKCISGNCKNGKGVYQMKNGSRYEGEFKDGKFHGKGTYFFFNGSRYEGYWENGEMSGKGTWHYANGMKLEGTFSKDRVIDEQEIIPVKIERSASKVISVIPGTTRMLVKFKSIESAFKDFPVGQEHLFKKDYEKMMLKKIIDQVGFNPFMPEEIAKQGIDIKREIAIALPSLKSSGKMSDINIVACIPVTDRQKAIINFKNILRRLSKMKITFERDKDITIIKTNERGKTFCMAEKKGYLLVGFNPDGNVVPFMKSFMEDIKPLGMTDEYINISKKIDTDEEIFLYCDPVMLNSFYDLYTRLILGSGFRSMKNPAALMSNTFSMLKNSHQGLGMNISCDKKDLVIKGVYIFNPDSDLMKIYKGVKYSKTPVLGIKEHPVMLIASGINFNEYYKFILKSMGPEIEAKVKRKLKRLAKQEGIDIEKEIVNNLAGSFNFGIFDGASFNQNTLNSLVAFNVKDADAMRKTIEKLVQKIPPQSVKKTGKGKNLTYEIRIKILRIKVGISGKNVIIALGDDFFHKSMNASMKNSFLKKIKNKDLVSKMKSDNNVMYLSSDEISKLISAVPIFNMRTRGRHKELLSHFDYFFAYSILKGNDFFTDMIVTTDFKKPFFKGIADMFKPETKK